MIFCTEELPGERLPMNFSVTCFVKESLAGGTSTSVVQCYTGGPYFAWYSSSLKCSVIIVPGENVFLSLLCGEAEPIF